MSDKAFMLICRPLLVGCSGDSPTTQAHVPAIIRSVEEHTLHDPSLITHDGIDVYWNGHRTGH